jgi:hypothetical protein
MTETLAEKTCTPFHMTIEGDLRHFHNQYIDDARST